MALITATKLRAIADRLERDAAREVAELRRMADLLDGVAKVTRAKARPAKKAKAQKVTKAKKRVAKKAAKKKAKRVARKAARKTGSAKAAR